jgi:hypothetical protein
LQNQAVLEAPMRPAEAIRRTMTALNCFACHTRDKRGGVEGLRRAYPGGAVSPALAGLGARSSLDAITASLAHEFPVKNRATLRMPFFGPQNTAHLPALFMEADVK